MLGVEQRPGWGEHVKTADTSVYRSLLSPDIILISQTRPIRGHGHHGGPEALLRQKRIAHLKQMPMPRVQRHILEKVGRQRWLEMTWDDPEGRLWCFLCRTFRGEKPRKLCDWWLLPTTDGIDGPRLGTHLMGIGTAISATKQATGWQNTTDRQVGYRQVWKDRTYNLE